MAADELPLRAMRELIVVLDEEMDRRVEAGIDGHVDDWHRHVPGPRTGQLTAVPWPEDRIPDEHLAKMVEQLETTGAELAAVAQNLGYPPSLAERELARYQGATRRYVLGLAAH